MPLGLPRLSGLTYSAATALLCYGVVLFLFGPFLTAMAETFGVPLGRMGLLFSLFSVGLIPSVLVTGYLSEHWGKRRLLLGSVLLMAAGCAIFGAVPLVGPTPSFSLALAVMVFMGWGAGGIEALTNAVVADDNQPAPGFALNVAHAFFAVGAVLGPVAAGLLLRAGVPWQAGFYGAAGVLAVAFLFLLPHSAPSATRSGVMRFEVAVALMRSPVLWRLALVLGLYVGAEVGLTAWISPLMEEVLGSARGAAALSVSVFWVFMIIGRLATSALAMRVRPAPLIVAMSVGSVLGSAAVAWSPAKSLCLIASAGTGLFMSGIFGLVMTDAARVFPRHSGTVFGLLIAGVAAGALIVPAVMGYLADAGGLRIAMLAPAALMAAVTAIYAAAPPPAGPAGERR